MELAKNFGEWLKYIREEKLFQTKKEFCLRSEINYQTLTKYENSSINPSREALVKIGYTIGINSYNSNEFELFYLFFQIMSMENNIKGMNNQMIFISGFSHSAALGLDYLSRNITVGEIKKIASKL